MQQFISVEEARRAILSAVAPLDIERVVLGRAAGRRLAQGVRGGRDQPPFDNASRDGWAVRFDDLQAGEPLAIVGVVAAGDAPGAVAVGAGQAARVATGAPVPPGADTVVMREHGEEVEEGSWLEIGEVPGGAQRGDWIRGQGSYQRSGEEVLSAGWCLGGGELGMLAAMGQMSVEVHRAPRVAIVSTGAELVEVGREPGPGQIVNSNALMLEELVRQAGGEPVVLPIVADEVEATRRAFARACRWADLVVSSGGVSVGDRDHVGAALAALCGEGGLAFWKIRMKPGKPLAFGVATAEAGGAALLGLPGNPVSSFVCFHQFVAPALARMQGAPDEELGPRLLRAQLGTEVESSPRRREYVCGTLDWEDSSDLIFFPLSHQESGNLRLTCGVEAFGIVEEGVGQMSRGEAIEVELIVPI